EALEAIDILAAADARATGDATSARSADGHGGAAVAHLEEELGDLLFQVYFHARLAAEAGRFTLADVARRVHDKLVLRHPHVFGAARAGGPEEAMADSAGEVRADSAEEVMANWEVAKLSEKNRTSVTEGIPAALPALALAAKLQRKALAVGMVMPGVADEAVEVAARVARLVPSAGAYPEGHRGVDESGRADQAAELGALLFSVVNVARSLGVDPETALRARSAAFRASVEAHGRERRADRPDDRTSTQSGEEVPGP
ncbi:MAG: MazG nucleotide pyrophosphohydrolase domain-containing protein, partial [Acidimicrobiales bacterium]